MIELAILKNFDSGTYKAAVQLVGSLTTYFDAVSVSKSIPSSALVVGNFVIVAIPGGNPKDACVIASWPQGSGGGGAGSFLELSDTPDSYSGQAGKSAKVKANESGLEFFSAWEKVAEVLVPSNCDYVDFNSLNINIDKVYTLFALLKNGSATMTEIYLYRNGDYTNANYYLQYLRVYGTSIGYDRLNSPNVMWMPGSGVTFGYVNIARSILGHMLAGCLYPQNSGSAIEISMRMVSSANTTSNITSLRIAAYMAGGIGAGSILILCKPRTS
jgi:hypothetical protein